VEQPFSVRELARDNARLVIVDKADDIDAETGHDPMIVV
jgi:hypothetical protein